MLKKSLIFLLLILFLIVSKIMAQKDSSQIEFASQKFNEINEICNAENGRLWGENLGCPILIINWDTRFVVANEADSQNILKKSGDIYIGYFPYDKIISNSTTTFGGKFWTMLGYPMGENNLENTETILHEMFHHLQENIGLHPIGGYGNNHFDNIRARIYLKLEWLALEKAVKSSDSERKHAITDALYFRKYRRSLFASADSMENKFELHEGLPEFTAYTLLYNNNDSIVKVNLLNNKFRHFGENSYIRSFGYYSGFLYAYLLDKSAVEWRKGLKYNDDLGFKLQNAYNITLSSNLEKILGEIELKYDYKRILKYELKLQHKKDKVIMKYRTHFIKNTVLNIHLINAKLGLKSSDLQPLDSLGTIFPMIDISDDWGYLKVNKGGCLLSLDSKKASLPAEKITILQRKIISENWSIELSADYFIKKENGNYWIVRKD